MRTNERRQLQDGVPAPFEVEEAVDGSGVILMSKPGGMRAAELLPVELAVAHATRHFIGQVDGGDIVTVGHRLVVHDDLGLYTLVQQGNEGVVDEVEHDDVHLRTDGTRMAENAFHAAHLLDVAEAVGVVVHGRLDKQQVGNRLPENVILEAEGVGRAARRRDSGIYKGELRIGETLPQVFLYHVAPATHLGDRTAEEGHAAFLLLREFQVGIGQTAASVDDLLPLVVGLVADNEVDHGFGLLQAVGMVVAAGLQNDFHQPAQGAVTFGNDLHVPFVGYRPVAVAADADNGDACLH